MYHEFETDPQTAETDDERRESATEAWEPRRLLGQTVGESLRVGAGMTALTTHQVQQLFRSQIRSAVLLQRLATTSAGMAFAAPTGRSRAPERESAESGARAGADGDERDTDEASAGDTDEPDQPGNGDGQQGTPVVRRTPDGELAFKQWQPQRLSVEPPEHDRLTAEKRRERAQSAATSRSETSEKGPTGSETSEEDSGRPEASDTDTGREEGADEAAERSDPAAEML